MNPEDYFDLWDLVIPDDDEAEPNDGFQIIGRPA